MMIRVPKMSSNLRPPQETCPKEAWAGTPNPFLVPSDKFHTVMSLLSKNRFRQ